MASAAVAEPVASALMPPLHWGRALPRQAGAAPAALRALGSLWPGHLHPCEVPPAGTAHWPWLCCARGSPGVPRGWAGSGHAVLQGAPAYAGAMVPQLYPVASWAVGACVPHTGWGDAELCPTLPAPCAASQVGTVAAVPAGLRTINGLSRMCVKLLNANSCGLSSPARSAAAAAGCFLSPSGGIPWLPSQTQRPRSHGPRPPASTLCSAAESSLLVG